MLAAGTDLVVVGRAGIGLDNVDVATATKRGVMVVNAPQSNVLSAAEQTIALMLAQARNIPQADADLKAGQWNRSRWAGVELHGKTLGIVGLGRVGVLVAQRAHAFGMRLAAYDPYVSADRAHQLGIELAPSLEALVEMADFLTIHLPKTKETIGLIDADLLARAKPGMRLINTARGGIVDEAVLAKAIESGQIAGAALDVFATEPTTESPLFGLPSVVVTPHLGASTVEAQDKAGQTIADQVVLALRGEFVPFAVNVAATEANSTVQPFLPLVERLGRLFSALVGRQSSTRSRSSYEGQIADYDCRVLTLGVLKGVLAPGRRRAGELRERAAAGRGAGRRRARDEALLGPGLREPDRAAGPGDRAPDARGRHAHRQAGVTTHRRASTTTRWTSRRRPTCSSCATTTSPG